MIIGILRIAVHIPLARSLKEKRRHLNSLKAKLSAAFNVSVAEVGRQDDWQHSVLAIVHVGITRPVVDALLARITAVVENSYGLQLTHYETEMIA